MSILRDLKSLFLPNTCPICRRRLMPDEHNLCINCAASLPRVAITNTQDNIMLRTLWTDVPAQHALSLIHYRPHSHSHNLVMRFKYHGGKQLAWSMGCWAGHELRKAGMDEVVDVLVPVPLSRSKLRIRGYNQSEMLAEGIAHVIHKPVCNLLRRDEGDHSQARLNAAQRKENVKGVFHAAVPEALRGKRVLLVDDVMTTGATMKSCALALLEDDPTIVINSFAFATAT